jgi:hypothetical protein
VKLRPRAGGDVFDLALAGKTAVVDVVETDMEGRVFVGVLVDDDPGAISASAAIASSSPRRRSRPCGCWSRGSATSSWAMTGSGRARPRVSFDGVDVADFGIRGMDLAYALADYDVAIFLDATPRGEPPGNAVS